MALKLLGEDVIVTALGDFHLFLWARRRENIGGESLWEEAKREGRSLIFC